jgi:MYXO-CTERM domain-containing protein
VLVVNNVQGYICTGTVIDRTTVLTAAHCVEDGVASHYDVAGGTDPFNGADWVRGADDVIEHPNYDPNDFGVHDIGIILLSSAAPVDPIRYQRDPDSSIYDVGRSVEAIGYGITSEAGNGSGVKRKVTMPIEQVASDAYAYGGPTKNICSGDSGGPDIVIIDGQEVAIGVHSYGDVDCLSLGVSVRTDDNDSFIAQYVTEGGGGGGGGGEDDDDGYGLFGCAVAGTSANPALGVLALLALAMGRRRR